MATRTTPTGAWSAFGASCFVTFKVPTTVISPVYCGTTINYLQQDTIHANALGVADGYRFRIESGGTIIEDTVANPSAYNGITFRKFQVFNMVRPIMFQLNSFPMVVGVNLVHLVQFQLSYNLKQSSDLRIVVQQI